MAEGDLHKKKRAKNLMVLGLIAAWCLLIFLITIVRMASAAELPCAGGERFAAQRAAHQASMDDATARMQQQGQTYETARGQRMAAIDQERSAHLVATGCGSTVPETKTGEGGEAEIAP